MTPTGRIQFFRQLPFFFTSSNGYFEVLVSYLPLSPSFSISFLLSNPQSLQLTSSVIDTMQYSAPMLTGSCLTLLQSFYVGLHL